LLTDYHVHLRPDEEGSTAERYFTSSNVDRYREAAEERGIELDDAKARGIVYGMPYSEWKSRHQAPDPAS
jgi:hypothetical protein